MSTPKDPTLLYVLWTGLAASFTVVGLFIRAVLTGKLATKRELDDVRADRDGWKVSSDLKDQTITEFGGRLEANTEALNLVLRLVEALAAKGQRL